MGQLVDRRRVVRISLSADGPAARAQPDQLAVEAPLTLKAGGETVATTMRTPGHDLELALGWLVAEGVVRRPDEVLAATMCSGDTVELRLTEGVEPPRPRLGATSSACGVCGSDTIDEVMARRGPASAGAFTVSAEVLLSLPDRLREAQRAFRSTGGLHAAGLFTADGELVCAREDVGRHNAVDKVVGWALQQGRLPASSLVLQVSGRASFELTQKAAMAGLPVLSAVSAPSTLAVDLAREAGITLAGFVRGTSMNLYAGDERVLLTSSPSDSQSQSQSQSESQSPSALLPR